MYLLSLLAPLAVASPSDDMGDVLFTLLDDGYRCGEIAFIAERGFGFECALEGRENAYGGFACIHALDDRCEPDPGDCIGTTAAIYSQEDVADYVGCTELDSVYLHITSDVTDVSLPNLQTVNNYVYFHQNVDVETVSMPSLTSVGSYVYFHDNNALLDVDLSALETVGAYLYVYGNEALETFEVTESLTWVEQYASFSGNSSLCVPELDWATIAQTGFSDSGNSSSCP